MKSMLILVFAGLALLVSGQFFGWWRASVPGLEAVPSYEHRKNANEAERSKRRRINGMEDENGNRITDEHTRRRAEALKNGGGILE